MIGAELRRCHPEVKGGWLLRFPPPERAWSINEERSKHWSKTNPLKVAWRDGVYQVAQISKLGALEGRWQVTLILPFARNDRRDPHNYFVVAKACVDGLVNAGTWHDDTPRYVTVAEPHLVVTKSPDALAVLELTPAPLTRNPCACCGSPAVIEQRAACVRCSDAGFSPNPLF